MISSAGDVIRHLGSGWEPHVEESSDGHVTYSFPVASGHVDTSFTFDITREDLAVLLADPSRRALLQAVSHTVAQRLWNAFGQADFDVLVAEVLHSAPVDLDDYIDRINSEYRDDMRWRAQTIMARDEEIPRSE
jgi:hypothetical protein